MADAIEYCSISIDIASATKNALDLSTPLDPLRLLKTLSFANGSGDQQAHAHWHDQRSLNATTSETLDLTALTGGPFGSVVLTDVRAIAIFNTSDVGDLEIGGAAANAWEPFVKAAGDIVLVKKCGSGTGAWSAFIWVAPDDGTGAVSGSAKNLKINNAGGSAQTYQIYILGTTS